MKLNKHKQSYSYYRPSTPIEWVLYIGAFLFIMSVVVIAIGYLFHKIGV